MKHDEFVGQVQHRAALPSRGAAEAVIRCTLETLAERLTPAVASHLADQLPPEVGHHLRGGQLERFSVHDFYARIAFREGIPVMLAEEHARVVLELISRVVSAGILDKVMSQLPHTFASLFIAPYRGRVRAQFHLEDFGEQL